MFTPIQIGAKEKGTETPSFTPMPVGAKNERVGFTPLPLLNKIDKGMPIKFLGTEKEEGFDIKTHPNLYGAYGAAKETGKALIPYLKYLDPEERSRFMGLSKQKQVRALLFETLDTVLYAGFKPLSAGGKAVVKKYFPDFFKKASKVANIKIGKSKKTVAQKIGDYKAKHDEMPPREKIDSWWGEASKKPVKPKATVEVKPKIEKPINYPSMLAL